MHDVMLEEKHKGKKLDLLHMKVFDYIAYLHLLNELQTKPDPKAKSCVLIGYCLEQKGYKW